jgi:hypothetical protein
VVRMVAILTYRDRRITFPEKMFGIAAAMPTADLLLPEFGTTMPG